jgi:hypothetical protein
MITWEQWEEYCALREKGTLAQAKAEQAKVMIEAFKDLLVSRRVPSYRTEEITQLLDVVLMPTALAMIDEAKDG